jgi:hypothetical protein
MRCRLRLCLVGDVRRSAPPPPLPPAVPPPAPPPPLLPDVMIPDDAAGALLATCVTRCDGGERERERCGLIVRGETEPRGDASRERDVDNGATSCIRLRRGVIAAVVAAVSSVVVELAVANAIDCVDFAVADNRSLLESIDARLSCDGSVMRGTSSVRFGGDFVSFSLLLANC